MVFRQEVELKEQVNALSVAFTTLSDVLIREVEDLRTETSQRFEQVEEAVKNDRDEIRRLKQEQQMMHLEIADLHKKLGEIEVKADRDVTTPKENAAINALTERLARLESDLKGRMDERMQLVESSITSRLDNLEQRCSKQCEGRGEVLTEEFSKLKKLMSALKQENEGKMQSARQDMESIRTEQMEDISEIQSRFHNIHGRIETLEKNGLGLDLVALCRQVEEGSSFASKFTELSYQLTEVVRDQDKHNKRFSDSIQVLADAMTGVIGTENAKRTSPLP